MIIKIDKCDYNRIIDLINSYLDDIYVDSNDEYAELKEMPNAEDLLSDILTELGIEKE